jgi:hypothetical protein
MRSARRVPVWSLRLRIERQSVSCCPLQISRLRRIVVVLALVACAGCSPGKLAPIPSHALLPASGINGIVAGVARFEGASGLAVVEHTDFANGDGPSKGTGESARYSARLGFFVNRYGALRLDLYPASGFVSLASAVVDRQRVIALDRIERRGIESEDVVETTRQLLGVGLDPIDLVVLLTGGFPLDLEPDFGAAVANDDGTVSLRDQQNRLEVSISNGLVTGLTRSLRGGRLAVASREAYGGGNGGIRVAVRIIGPEDEPISTSSIIISGFSTSRAVSNRLFELDSTGYSMRRRLK